MTDPDVVMSGYADISLSDVVRDDIRKAAFFDRTTSEADNNGRVDPLITMFNEGKRALWLQIEARIARARKGKSTQQVKAVSETAEDAA